jgi:hypothetical protein
VSLLVRYLAQVILNIFLNCDWHRLHLVMQSFPYDEPIMCTYF